MGKLNAFLNSKIIKTDVGEETYLTWKETISYAVGRGAQGMNTSMTSSKYINYFLTNVLFKKQCQLLQQYEPSVVYLMQ